MFPKRTDRSDVVLSQHADQDSVDVCKGDGVADSAAAKHDAFYALQRALPGDFCSGVVVIAHHHANSWRHCSWQNRIQPPRLHRTDPRLRQYPSRHAFYLLSVEQDAEVLSALSPGRRFRVLERTQDRCLKDLSQTTEVCAKKNTSWASRRIKTGAMSQKSAHHACGSWTRALDYVEVALQRYVAPPMNTATTAAWTSCCSETVASRVRAAAAARHRLSRLLDSSPAFTLTSWRPLVRGCRERRDKARGRGYRRTRSHTDSSETANGRFGLLVKVVDSTN
jgi:hypothetical protein